LLRTNYGFRYSDQSNPLMAIRTIGWESTVNESYSWNGLARDDKFVVFQYTLSGEGHLVHDGKHYTVPKNHGFFVRIPGNHHYYYSSESKTPWEFIFLTATGSHVFAHWNEIIETNGPVISLKPNAQPIAMLWEMMQSANEKTLQDKYDISVRLYEWIVACHRIIDGKPEAGQPVPASVSTAIKFMEGQYHRFLTLEEIAEAAGASKYHFCRLFVKSTGVTPIHQLTKIRIEEASKLLRQTNQSVAAIAAATGFDNSSYFGKVFRRMMGDSPQQFRENTDDDIPANHLFID
jgi:AraC family transcriptional regulator